MKQTAMWKQVAFSLLILAAAGAVWQFRTALFPTLNDTQASPSSSQPKQDGLPVIVSEVIQVQDTLTFTAIGTGDAIRSVTLRAPSSGAINDLAIMQQRKFQAGDTLMRLDDTNEQLAVQLAEVRLAQAASERDRVRSLKTTGIAAAARLEEAETGFQIARIELDKARADLADRTLLAPFDGYAGLASLDIGDRLVKDDEITSYDDRSQILVEFDVPEALLGRIKPGLTVAASTPSVMGQTFEGQITAIDSRVDDTTRTARVRAGIENPNDVLRPGASFSLRINLPGKSYPAVPEIALQFSRGAMAVWRVSEGKAEQLEVRLIRRRAGLVIVESALREGDLVVVEGTQRLRNGSQIRVLNSPSEGNS